jgi:hypothetical protein
MSNTKPKNRIIARYMGEMIRRYFKKKISSKDKTVRNIKVRKIRIKFGYKYEIVKFSFIFTNILQRKLFWKFANIRKVIIFSSRRYLSIDSSKMCKKKWEIHLFHNFDGRYRLWKLYEKYQRSCLLMNSKIKEFVCYNNHYINNL